MTRMSKGASRARTRWRSLAVLVSACLLILGGVAFVAQGLADEAGSPDNLACTGDHAPANFAVYSAGPTVGALDVTSIIRRCDQPQPGVPGRANYVSYLYGICPELADGDATSCAPPLEVQTWPACERSLADYELTPGVPYPHDRLGQLDGVPAYSFDEGTRVELYSATVTIVIFSADPQLIDDAVGQLQSEPADEPPGEPTGDASSQASDLPDPEPGAMAGELSCA